jgi:hypothetical protein
MKLTLKKIGLGTGVLVFGSLLAILVSAASFTGPTSVAPGGNTEAPVNVGPSFQSKAGDLDVKAILAEDAVISFDAITGGVVAVGNYTANFLDPTNYPTNALEVWGRIVMRGSSLESDMVDTRISNVDMPIDDRDVATKKYVDAATGGGGGPTIGPTLTLFGTAPVTTNYYFGGNNFRGPNSGVPPSCRTNLTCLLGQYFWGGLPSTFAPVPPGVGAPSCNSLDRPETTIIGAWLEVFAGYGPHETIKLSFKQGSDPSMNPNHFLLSSLEDLNEAHIPSNAVSISDSVCSNAVIENVNVVTSNLGGQVMATAGANSACSTGGCNTCRICVFVPNSE